MMLLSTTSAIDNYSVKEYCGIVCHNVVIGSNLISDFLASFSDVFGGGSGTYRTKMDNMYNEAIKSLSFKAKSLGANAVIGIKLDFDEISGQGKQMFMLCVSVTAVKIFPKESDRYELYDILYNLKKFFNEGIITEEEYNFEKNRVQNNFENAITRETNDHLEYLDRQEKYKKEQQAAEIKRKELFEERMKLFLEPRDVILDASTIMAADYSDTPIDESQPLDDIIKQFIELNRIDEACKYYIEQTGLGVDDAIDYVMTVNGSVE